VLLWAGVAAIFVTLLGSSAMGADTSQRITLRGRVESRANFIDRQMVLDPSRSTWSSVANFEVLHSGEVTVRIQGNSSSRLEEKHLGGGRVSAAMYDLFMEEKKLALSSGSKTEVRFPPGVQRQGIRASLKFRMAEPSSPINVAPLYDVLNVIVVLA